MQQTNNIMNRIFLWTRAAGEKKQKTVDDLKKASQSNGKPAKPQYHDQGKSCHHESGKRPSVSNSKGETGQLCEKIDAFDSKLSLICSKLNSIAQNITSEISGEKHSKEVNITPLVAVFQSIQEDLKGIHGHVADKTELDQATVYQSETLRQMASRIRELEDNLINEHILEPILKSVVFLYDSVSRTKTKLKNLDADEASQVSVPEVLKGLEQEILDMLACYGVTLMNDTTNELDPKKQKVVGIKNVKQIENNKIISKPRKGFYYGDKILRSEEVIVQHIKEEECVCQ